MSSFDIVKYLDDATVIACFLTAAEACKNPMTYKRRHSVARPNRQNQAGGHRRELNGSLGMPPSSAAIAHIQTCTRCRGAAQKSLATDLTISIRLLKEDPVRSPS
jgi:hypothetical protein